MGMDRQGAEGENAPRVAPPCALDPARSYAGRPLYDLQEMGGGKSAQKVWRYAQLSTRLNPSQMAQHAAAGGKFLDIAKPPQPCKIDVERTQKKQLRSLVTASSDYYSFVVGRAGFEPATNGLKVRCSTS